MKKAFVAVVTFDVDEGCDFCTKENVTHSMGARILAGERMDGLDTDWAPTYHLSSIVVYDGLADLQADVADGTTGFGGEV